MYDEIFEEQVTPRVCFKAISGRKKCMVSRKK